MSRPAVLRSSCRPRRQAGKDSLHLGVRPVDESYEAGAQRLIGFGHAAHDVGQEDGGGRPWRGAAVVALRSSTLSWPLK